MTGDITAQDTDAIVNAANSSLMGGGGVDGAIHRAGGPLILEECRKIVAAHGTLPPGQAVATTGGKLKAAYVIHTVGPIWQDGDANEAAVLASCYRESIRLADKIRLHNISFPSISTGAFGYPTDKAAEVAIATVAAELESASTVRAVTFVLFGERTYNAYSQAAAQFARTSATRRTRLERLDTTATSSRNTRENS
jgi:O-acetyl-ADP-ribose deacetylase (regulator of RNase III)